MNNRERLIKTISQFGYSLSIYDHAIDKLSSRMINKITNSFMGDSTDIDVTLNRKPCVVEMSVVDNEVDITMLTKEQYINRYGNERWEE